MTRQVENSNLSGIKHRRMTELAKARGIKVRERPFTLNEAKSARKNLFDLKAIVCHGGDEN